MSDDTTYAVPAVPNPVLAMQRELLDMYAGMFQRSREMFRSVSIGDINVYFPFGYGFTNNANPATNWGWMFGMMATEKPRTEQRIVSEVASYGKQIGWMMDMLIPLAEESEAVDKGDLAEMKAMRERIEEIKSQDR